MAEEEHEGPPDFAEMGVPRLVELWNVELEEAPVTMALSPKQQLLAVGTVDDAIAVLDVGSGKTPHTLGGHKGGTNGVAFLSGNSLVSVGEDGHARIWNVARGTCVHELPVDAEGADRRGARGHCVTHLTVAPGGRSFACAAGRLISVFSLGGSAAAPPTKRVLGPMDSTVESLRYDGRGNLLATYNNGCSYWKLAERSEGEKQELPLPAPGAMLCGDVKPSGDYIVAGCHDCTVHIYWFKSQAASGVQLEELSCGGYDSKVTAVDFNPAGDRMASSGGDKNTVWDFSKGPDGSTPTLTVGHLGTITAQAWQPDLDGWLATGARDGRIQVHDVTDAVAMRPGHPLICQPGIIGVTDDDEVTCLIFARDGVLYSGHISGAVRKWQLPTASSDEEEEEEEEDEEAAQRAGKAA